MKERFNWFSTAIFCYILFFVFASLPMPASCQPLEFGNNARVHIPVYMDYTDIDDIKSANFRVMWDSTHFDYVDYVRPAYWDSLGFTRVINLQDTSSGLLRLAFAGVNSLEGDSLLFTLVMDTPNDLSVGGFVQVDAMFNEEDFRIKTVDYIIDPTLPVELVDFNATINNNRIFATWTTQSEQNAAGFEVYAISHIWQDDGRWVPSTSYYLGYVAAQGHSTEKNEYAITGFVKPGLYRLRLRQIDFDGRFEDFYSRIYGVDMDKSHVELYPNPANPEVTINITVPSPEHVTVTLYNVLGQDIATIFQSVVGGTQTVHWDLSSLRSGVYFVALQSKTGIVTKKLTVLK